MVTPNIAPRGPRVSVAGLVFALASVACAATCMAWFGRTSWTMELATHFRFQYFLVLLPAALFGMTVRAWKQVAVLLLFAGINFACLAPLWFPARVESLSKAYAFPGAKDQNCSRLEIRLMKFNVLTMNPRKDLVIESIMRHDPDMVLCEEVDGAWLEILAGGIGTSHPHQISRPRADNFGIALFSKVPLIDSRIVHLDESDPLPGIFTKFLLGGRSVTLFGQHILPPRNKDYSASRNRHMKLISGLMKKVKGPVVFMGDLNATPWSPNYQDLLAESGLINTMSGFGVQATWPAGLPWFMRIPIDHCLVSGDFQVVNRFNCEFVGSDHLPFVVDLIMR